MNCWPLFVPSVGTFCSQRGNILFPVWERFLPNKGTFSENKA